MKIKVEQIEWDGGCAIKISVTETKTINHYIPAINANKNRHLVQLNINV